MRTVVLIKWHRAPYRQSETVTIIQIRWKELSLNMDNFWWTSSVMFLWNVTPGLMQQASFQAVLKKLPNPFVDTRKQNWDGLKVFILLCWTFFFFCTPEALKCLRQRFPHTSTTTTSTTTGIDPFQWSQHAVMDGYNTHKVAEDCWITALHLESCIKIKDCVSTPNYSISF